MGGRAGGHAGRQEVPRLLQRLGRDAADAPARVHPADARTAGGRARRAGRDRGEGGDLGRGKRSRAACGGYLCFEDEAGSTLRPPSGRTWGRRGHTPVVAVSGRRSGRLSVAGLIAWRPGSRTRLCHRLLTHPAGKGTRRSMSERDYIALLNSVHQLVKAPVVLVWGRLNTHVSKTMRELIAGRDWLAMFLLPACSPQLNQVEGAWAHIKRSTHQTQPRQPRRRRLHRLETLVRDRLKRLQYRPCILEGFIAGTGLPLDTPTSP
ncbi:transposase [Streptomyces chrestomyceticus]|uniref:transposase n=1 Tax=Streptomyces chrestomyceticus TaxID=68185 RepID=UPI0027D95C4B|nr:transposase [Streptomyces chrestomyceticus]